MTRTARLLCTIPGVLNLEQVQLFFDFGLFVEGGTVIALRKRLAFFWPEQ